jgi:hypothetical protein
MIKGSGMLPRCWNRVFTFLVAMKMRPSRQTQSCALNMAFIVSTINTQMMR